MQQQYERNELCLVAVQKKGFHGFSTKFHSHLEIMCVLDGCIKASIDKKDYIIKSGEFCVVFPFVLHSYEYAPDAAFRLIMVAPKQIPEIEKELYSVKPETPCYQLDRNIAMVTENIVRCMDQGDSISEKMAYGYTIALVGEILQRSSLTDANEKKSNAIKDLLIYCNSHFTEEINVSTAAAACFVSESLVSKVFSKEIGCSFRTYVNSLRIDYACRLLEKTDMRIIDVMYACGFRNQTSFNRVFLEICRQTPRQYRNGLDSETGQIQIKKGAEALTG